MLKVDWDMFASSVRAHAAADAYRWKDVEDKLGLSHARVISAAQGKPVGTEIFLTLCDWMDSDPLSFVDHS